MPREGESKSERKRKIKIRSKRAREKKASDYILNHPGPNEKSANYI